MEPRQLLAPVANLTVDLDTIYEGGTYYGNRSDWANATKDGGTKVRVSASGFPTSYVALDSARLIITGQVDSYGTSPLGTLIDANTRYIDLGGTINASGIWQPSGPSVLDLTASDDDSTNITPSSLGADTLDFSDDNLTLKFEVTYHTIMPAGSPTTVSSTVKSLTIVDNDVNNEIHVTALDDEGTHKVEHFYANTFFDVATFRVDLPQPWNGGTIYIDGSSNILPGEVLLGELTLGSNLQQVPGTNKWSIAPLPGMTSVTIEVAPQGDHINGSPDKDITFSFRVSDGELNTEWVEYFTPNVFNNVNFPDKYVHEYHTTVSDSVTITLKDERERLLINSAPNEVMEYAVPDSDGDDFAYIKITPENSAYLLATDAQQLGRAYLEIRTHQKNEQDEKNSAQPGNKDHAPTGYLGPDQQDYYLETLDGIPLVLSLVSGTTDKYRALLPQTPGASSITLRVVPYNDTEYEDDETIDAFILLQDNHITPTPLYENGDTQITIKEKYVGNRVDSEVKSEGCNCDCGCSGAVIVTIDPTGGGTLKSDSGPFQTTANGGGTSTATISIGIPMLSNKAVPLSLSVRLETYEYDEASSNNRGSGQGQKKTAIQPFSLANASLDLTGVNPGDVVWFVAVIRSDSELASVVGLDNANAMSDALANLRTLIHPIYASSATTAQRISGWVGFGSTPIKNDTTGNLNLPEQEEMEGEGGTSYTVYANNSTGATNLSILGVERAIMNATILRPTDLPTFGADQRLRGIIEEVPAQVFFHADGSTTTFIDGVAPDSLSTLISGGYQDRYGNQHIFNTQGQEIIRKDAQGNATYFTYDASGGWVSSIIDQFGDGYNIDKTNEATGTYSFRMYRNYDRANPFSSSNPYIDLIWQSGNSSGNYGRTGAWKIIGIDPDGAGPRESLVETWHYTDGSLTSAERGTLSDPHTQWISFGYASNVSQAGTGGNSYSLATLTRQDGATKQVESVKTFLPAIRPNYNGVVKLNSPNTNTYAKFVKTTVAAGNPFDERLSSVTDWNGNRTIYKTDYRGRVLQMWDPKQVEALGIKSMSINDLVLQDRLKNNTDLSTVFQRFVAVRDGWGRLTSGMDFGEILAEYSVDPDKVMVNGVLQSNGPQTPQVTTYQYSGGKNPTVITQPLQNSAQYGYNDYFDLVTSAKDGNWSLLTRGVDSYGLVTSERTYFDSDNDGDLYDETIPIQEKLYTYLTSATLPRGLVTSVSEKIDSVSPLNVTTYTYIDNQALASHGRVATMTLHATSSSPMTTTYTYDASGRLATEANTMGVTKYYYDKLDRLIAVVQPDSDGAGPLLSAVTRFDYNSLGFLVSTELINSYVDTATAGSTKLLVTSLVDAYEYNSQGNLIKEYQQRGDTIRYLILDGSGNITTTTDKSTALAGTVVTSTALLNRAQSNTVLTGTPQTVTSLRGLVTTTSYDYMRNVTSVSQQDVVAGSNARTTTVAYNALNDPYRIVTSNPGGNFSATPDDVRDANGGFITNFTFDNLQRLLSTTDGLGRVTTYTYDAANRVKSSNLNNNGVNELSQLNYIIDANGWRIQSTDAEGRVVELKSDPLGRPVKVSGDAPESTAQYRADGQMASSTDALLRQTTYNYDALGRLTQVVQPAVNSVSPTTTFDYTSYRINTIVDPMGREQRFQYDANGNVLRTYQQVVPSKRTNLALAGTASQSSTLGTYYARNAIDGDSSGNPNSTRNTLSYTNEASNGWWQVELPSSSGVDEIEIFNRVDAPNRLSNFRVSIYDGIPGSGGVEVWGKNYLPIGSANPDADTIFRLLGSDLGDQGVRLDMVNAKVVRIQINGVSKDGNGAVTLAEVKVWGQSRNPRQYLQSQYSFGSDQTFTVNPNLVPRNLAVEGKASQAYVGGVYTYGYADANRAIDGNTNGSWTYGSTAFSNTVNNNWWQVELADESILSELRIFNSSDSDKQPLLSNFRVSIYDKDPNFGGVELWGKNYTSAVDAIAPLAIVGTTLGSDGVTQLSSVRAKFIRVQLNGLNGAGNQQLYLAEVQAWGLPVSEAFGTYTGSKYDALGNTLVTFDNKNDPYTHSFDYLNQPTRYVRDARGRVVTQFDEKGKATKFTYNELDELVTLTDASGNTTKYYYDNVGNVSQVDQSSLMFPSMVTSRYYGYDGGGNLREGVDRNGRWIQYEYDDADRLTVERFKEGSTTVQTYTYTYDRVGNLIGVDDSNAQGTDFSFAYDRLNRLQLERQALGFLGKAIVLDRDFDAVGNRTGLAANIGGTITASSMLSPTATSTITGGIKDFVNSYSYDTLDRLIKVTQGGAAGGNAVSEKQAKLSYNLSGQLTEMRRYSSVAASPASNTLEVHARYDYDTIGRLTSIAYGTQEITATDIWSSEVLGTGVVASSNVKSAYKYQYDNQNRLSSFGSLVDGWIERYRYDTTDQIIQTNRQMFDAASADVNGSLITAPRQDAISIPIVNPSFEDITLADGVSSTAAPNGWTKTNTAGVYNPNAAAMPLRQATDGVNAAYLQGGKLEQTIFVSLEASKTYSLLVDIGNRANSAYGDHYVELYAGSTLLARSTVDDQRAASGDYATTIVQYTAPTTNVPTGYLRIALYSTAAQVLVDNVRLFKSNSNGYSYDSTGNQYAEQYYNAVSITNSSFEDGISGWTSGQYNTTVPTGWTATGSVGSLKPSVGMASPTSTDGQIVAYLNDGSSISQTLSGGLEAGYRYRLQMDLATRSDIRTGAYQVELYAGTTLLAQSSNDILDVAPGAYKKVSLEYVSPVIEIPSGNLKIVIKGTRQILVDNVQLYKHFDTAYFHNQIFNDANYGYQYDLEGNLIRRSDSVTGAVREYQWDHRNRLIGVTDKTAYNGTILQNVQYVYDVFDRKIAKRLDSDGNGTFDFDTAWVYDGDQAVLQFEDIDGEAATNVMRLSNRYLYGDIVDMLLADEKYFTNNGIAINAGSANATAGQTLWPMADHLGSIRDIVDNNGVVREHIDYDVNGNRIVDKQYDASGVLTSAGSAQAVDELFGYTGRDWDADSDLQYNRARWYDPTTGRWISQDPISFAAGDVNLYRYVGNHSSYGVDPSGLHEPGSAVPDPHAGQPYRPHPKLGMGPGFQPITYWVPNPDYKGPPLPFVGNESNQLLPSRDINERTTCEIGPRSAWSFEQEARELAAQARHENNMMMWDLHLAVLDLMGAGVGVSAFRMKSGSSSSLAKPTSMESHATRAAAFRAAKRAAGIPRGQQPTKVVHEKLTDNRQPVYDSNYKQAEAREYHYMPQCVIIQEHSLGHKRGDVPPHFNVRPMSSPHHGTIPGVPEHFTW